MYMRALFLIALIDVVQSDPRRHCAYFDCHFFVAPRLTMLTPGGYGHNPTYEWLRMWRFRPGQMHWISHAPPALIAPAHLAPTGLPVANTTGTQWVSLSNSPAQQNYAGIGSPPVCFTHRETRAHGLVFTHYAYAVEDQVHTHVVGAKGSMALVVIINDTRWANTFAGSFQRTFLRLRRCAVAVASSSSHRERRAGPRG